jgi:hypothetical protein
MRVDPGDTYRLEVVRSDGAKSVAYTVVPEIKSLGPVYHSDVLERGNGDYIQRVTLPGNGHVWDVDVSYLFENAIDFERFSVPYSSKDVDRNESTFGLELELVRDQTLIRSDLYKSDVVRGSDPFLLTRIGLRLRVVDSEWYPVTQTGNMESLALPTAYSNVENGFGIWSSMGTYFTEWSVSLQTSQKLGYGL